MLGWAGRRSARSCWPPQLLTSAGRQSSFTELWAARLGFRPADACLLPSRNLATLKRPSQLSSRPTSITAVAWRLVLGGRLAEAAAAVQAPLWTFPHPSLSHAAVGYMFVFLLAALVKLSLVPDQREELAQAVEAMRSQQAFLQAKVPAVQNQAKRMAGQMMGRWVTVVGSGVLEPVARRWKGQINELAKAWAQFDVLPEADHNTLVGTQNPEELLSRTMVLFLRAASNHPRNRIRSELTRQTFMLEGLPTDYIDAQGNTPLAQMWTALHYGDYTAYYLAIAYGIDPTPVGCHSKP